MSGQLLVKIFLWIFIWLAVWWPFYYKNKNGAAFGRKYYLTVGYFLTSAILLTIIFYQDLSLILARLTRSGLLFLILVCAAAVMAYHLARKKLAKPTITIKNNPNLSWLLLDNRYLAAKICEILFQQIMLALLIVWADQDGRKMGEITILLSLIFGLSHLYLIARLGLFFGAFFTSASIIASLVFPWLILDINNGFIFGICLHLLFYVISGLCFWAKKGEMRS